MRIAARTPQRLAIGDTNLRPLNMDQGARPALLIPDSPSTADSPAQILDGRALATTIRAEVKARIDDLLTRHPVLPGLAIVMVGDDPASRSYLNAILRTCAGV